jgi:hypothetical protein
VIESSLGYHIVRLVERGDHALSPAGRRFVRRQAVLDWLTARRNTTPIEIYAAS